MRSCGRPDRDLDRRMKRRMEAGWSRDGAGVEPQGGLRDGNGEKARDPSRFRIVRGGMKEIRETRRPRDVSSARRGFRAPRFAFLSRLVVGFAGSRGSESRGSSRRDAIGSRLASEETRTRRPSEDSKAVETSDEEKKVSRAGKTNETCGLFRRRPSGNGRDEIRSAFACFVSRTLPVPRFRRAFSLASSSSPFSAWDLAVDESKRERGKMERMGEEGENERSENGGSEG